MASSKSSLLRSLADIRPASSCRHRVGKAGTVQSSRRAEPLEVLRWRLSTLGRSGKQNTQGVRYQRDRSPGHSERNQQVGPTWQGCREVNYFGQNGSQAENKEELHWSNSHGLAFHVQSPERGTMLRVAFWRLGESCHSVRFQASCWKYWKFFCCKNLSPRTNFTQRRRVRRDGESTFLSGLWGSA